MTTQTRSQEGGATFIYSLAAVLAAGSGVLAAAFGGNLVQGVMAAITPAPAEVYRSRVAATCDQGWKDERYNRDQIHCYMTRDRARLCDPRERRALVDKLVAYDAAGRRWEARWTGMAAGMALNPKMLEVGVADARSRDPRLSEEERAAQAGNAWEASREVMSPMDQLIEDNRTEIPEQGVFDDLKGLVAQQILVADDFGWNMPKLVKLAFERVKPYGAPMCKPRDLQ